VEELARLLASKARVEVDFGVLIFQLSEFRVEIGLVYRAESHFDLLYSLWVAT